MFGEVNVLHHHAVTTANNPKQNFILSVLSKILHLTEYIKYALAFLVFDQAKYFYPAKNISC